MAVTDRTIEDAIDHGATSIAALAARCGAGADCGGCWAALEELLDEHLARAGAVSNVA
jgi:bacterioferritin-associated ferredoxin